MLNGFSEQGLSIQCYSSIVVGQILASLQLQGDMITEGGEDLVLLKKYKGYFGMCGFDCLRESSNF